MTAHAVIERNRHASLILSRIRVPKASELLADHFRAQIILGELSEGEFLPPEGRLIDTLGHSRATIREAFRILEAESLISVVKGSRTGAKVHRPSTELVSRYAGYVLQAQGTTVEDLYQTRLAIEPAVVHRLATSRDATAVGDLRGELARLGRLLNRDLFDDFIDAVSSFHGVLVEAGGIRTLAFMNRVLLDLVRNHQLDYKRRHPLDHGEQKKRLDLALRSYAKLIDLIEAGAVKEAVRHWRLHLGNAHDTWTADGEGERIVNSLLSDRIDW